MSEFEEPKPFANASAFVAGVFFGFVFYCVAQCVALPLEGWVVAPAGGAPPRATTMMIIFKVIYHALVWPISVSTPILNFLGVSPDYVDAGGIVLQGICWGGVFCILTAVLPRLDKKLKQWEQQLASGHEVDSGASEATGTNSNEDEKSEKD